MLPWWTIWAKLEQRFVNKSKYSNANVSKKLYPDLSKAYSLQVGFVIIKP